MKRCSVKSLSIHLCHSLLKVYGKSQTFGWEGKMENKKATSNEKPGSGKPSKLNPNELFLSCIARLEANWTVQPGRIEGIIENYKTVFDEVGPSRFVKGVSSIIQSGAYGFFPTCYEFRGYIPQAGKADATNHYCGKCDDGWLRSKNTPDAFVHNAIHETAVYPCPCRGGDVSVTDWEGSGQHSKREQTPNEYPAKDYAALARDRREHPD